jgi:hypothetical protein
MPGNNEIHFSFRLRSGWRGPVSVRSRREMFDCSEAGNTFLLDGGPSGLSRKMNWLQ